MSSIFRRACNFILIVFLCLLQYGCSISHNPSVSVVKKALQLQVQLTDQKLSEVLGAEAAIKEFSRVHIEESSFIDYPNEKILSVLGHFEYELQDSKDPLTSPFQLFLTRGEKKQSWILLNQQISSGNSKWTVYPIPIDT